MLRALAGENLKTRPSDMLHYVCPTFCKDKAILSGEKQHFKKWFDSVTNEKQNLEHFDSFFQLVIDCFS